MTGSFEEETTLPKGLESWNVERESEENTENNENSAAKAEKQTA